MTDFTDLLDLAAERLGGAVLAANDEFFAPRENLLRPTKPVWREGEYTERGKWMDGWETRRRRTPGFDWALVRLGLPGIVRGIVVDTSHFRGNHPEYASVEGCSARPDATIEALSSPDTRWEEILPRSALHGDSQNLFRVDFPHRLTHLRLNIHPDGGVARLRVHGDAVADWRHLGAQGAALDLAAADHGGRVIACNDMSFGAVTNLIMPGRAANMGDGWETRRRRSPGHDWAVVALCTDGYLRRVEVDTHHFKGNHPDGFSLEGCVAPDATVEAVTAQGNAWVEILPRSKLQAHTRHFFEDELLTSGPFTHVRLNIFPDGGVSRLRLHGTVSPEGLARQRLRRLNTLVREDAETELRQCCGAAEWARQMADRRPFATLHAMQDAGDAVWASLGPADWLEGFRAHPRTGERKAEAATGDELRATLADANRVYESRFGHGFIACATGRSAGEMLSLLQSRIANDPELELRLAADEQRTITRLRLEKMLVQ